MPEQPKRPRLVDRIGAFATVPHAFIKSKPSHVAMHVFVVLRMHANGETELAFPSITRICALSGCNRNTTVKALNELIASEWIVRFKRFGKPTIYAMQIPARSITSDTSIRSDTHSSIESDTSDSIESDTLTRTRRKQEPVRQDEGSATRTATPPPPPPAPTFEAPPHLKNQPKPPRKKAAYLEWECVKAYLDATGRKWCDRLTAELINDNITDAVKWAGVVTEWVGKGFNPTNISGMIDVYYNGWREVKAKAEKALTYNEMSYDQQVAYLDKEFARRAELRAQGVTRF